MLPTEGSVDTKTTVERILFGIELSQAITPYTSKDFPKVSQATVANFASIQKCSHKLNFICHPKPPHNTER